MTNNGYQIIQAVEVQPGLWGISSGIYENVRLVHCIEDGDLTVTFLDGTAQTISLITGDDVSLDGLTVEVLSGTFALNK